MRNAGNLVSGASTSLWKRVKIGNGGFVTGLDISADGLRKIIWTDVGGAFIKDSTDTEWRQLLTSASLPGADYDPIPNNGALVDGTGTYCGAIAPSDKTNIVIGFNSFLYRSTNGGTTFARMALAAHRMFCNTGNQRLWNKKIAYHPTDTNTIIVGTTADGIYYTTNASTAGGTWTAVTGITAGANTADSNLTPHLVAFDGGTPANVFISKHGTGVYRSSTGVAGTFTLVSTGPTGPSSMMVDSAGTLWVVDSLGGTNNIWKLPRASSTWTNLTGQPVAALCMAVNPADVTSLVVMGPNGEPMRSINGGTSWVGSRSWYPAFPAPIGIYTNATAVPWLGSRLGAGFPSHVQFDPVAANKVWMAQGIGVSWTNPPTTYVRWDWYDESAGSEELGFNNILSIPGNAQTLFGCYDKAIWRPVNPDVYSGGPIFPGTTEGVDHCYSMDYGAGAPNFVAAPVSFNRQISGYSNDGGATWQQFAAQHPSGSVVGGAIACTGAGNMVWTPGNNAPGVYSTNYGASWSPLLIGGVQLGGWVNSAFTNRVPITADKMRPGTVAMLLKNDVSQDVTKAGVWKSTDNGATSTKVFAGVIDTSAGADGAQYWHSKIAYIPGKSGELLYTGGKDFNSKMMYSANDAVGWTILRSGEIDLVRRFGFGKASPGNTYPAVIFTGSVSGVSGVYVSYDFFATTPFLLTRFPVNLAFDISCIGGDMNVFGRFYAGLSGNGLVYCDIPDLATGT